MKRLFTLLFFIFQFAIFNSQDWKLSVEPIFGMKYGEIGEYVFLKKYSNYKDDKLSELIWETKPEFYTGTKVGGGYKNIFGEFQFAAGIPKQTGSMMDYDWLNIDGNPNSLDCITNPPNKNYITNYSKSDNNLKYDFSFGIKAGYDFDIFENDFIDVNIKPIIAFDYRKFYFNGKNGYAWYGNKSDNHYLPYETATKPTYDFSGKDVIDYSRQTYITWLGFDISTAIQKYLIFNAGFQISPYTYAESIDIHYMNNYGKGTAYLDATPGYFSTFKWNLGSEYKINSRHSLLLSANWLYMRILRGDDYSKSYINYKEDSTFSTKNKVSTVDGGASEHYFDLSISYKFRIF